MRINLELQLRNSHKAGARLSVVRHVMLAKTESTTLTAFADDVL
jgi:hypothetical protein